MFSGNSPVYRLTDAGWNVIHRTHEWVVVTCIVSIITLIATIVGIALSADWIGQRHGWRV
jgi:hypothetical protein